ncbi:MAG: MBL fold metallo-hydrolase [Halobacteriales archaeon]|nr:MBL fold metallo-hydrolase [Halobacteriales archaeon]
MYFEQFADPGHGCLTHLVGCPSMGLVAVIDPFLPPQRYLDIAQHHGMQVTHIVDTHLHADHRSTGRELGKLSGAPYMLHTSADAQGFDGLNDQDRLKLGRVELEVLHTPGHTAESVCVAVRDLKRSPEEPWFVLTGDTLFVGDVGRPDVGVHGTHPRQAAAQDLHASLQKLLTRLDDGVEVFPSHYAGSSCGKWLSPKPSSTIGFERRHNLGLKPKTLGDFVAYAVQDLPPIPGAEQMLRINRGLA